MSVEGGPKITTSGLVLSVDARHPASMSGAGCGGFEGHDEGLTDIIDTSRKAKFMGDARVWGDVNFWTAVGVTYPETSYGGVLAGRHGLTSGYNNTSSGKTFNSSRSLHVYVWDQRNASWVSHTYFNGLRYSGHCYDTYSSYGPNEMTLLLADHEVLKKKYPEGIWVIWGSHADDYRNTASREMFADLGAGSSATTMSGRCEYVLVGQPGLGEGNAYVWALHNVAGYPNQVAHANFRVPSQATRKKGIYGGDKAVDFDGTGDYLDFGSDILISPDNQGWTAEYWFRTEAASTLQHFNSADEDEFNANWLAIYNSKLAVWNRSPGYWRYGDTVIQSNRWYCAHFVCDSGGTNMRFYIDGVREGGTHVNNVWTASYSSLEVRYIGSYMYVSSMSRYFNGQISAASFYNRALSEAEIKRNFNKRRHRR